MIVKILYVFFFKHKPIQFSEAVNRPVGGNVVVASFESLKMVVNFQPPTWSFFGKGVWAKGEN